MRKKQHTARFYVSGTCLDLFLGEGVFYRITHQCSSDFRQGRIQRIVFFLGGGGNVGGGGLKYPHFQVSPRI